MKKTVVFALLLCILASCFGGCKITVGGPKREPDNSSVEEDPIVFEEVVLDLEKTSSSVLTYDQTPLLFDGRATRAESGYTYRVAVSSLPSGFNAHQNSLSSNVVASYTQEGLYAFDYNLNMNGYRILPAMASDYPIDVTDSYAGSWGIPADATRGYAYRIELRDNLRFDNGDEIHADDFVQSVNRLIDPLLNNTMATQLFGGDLKIVNARNRYNSLKEHLVSSHDYYSSWETADKDKIYFTIQPGESLFGIWSANYSAYTPEGLIRAYMGLPNEDTRLLFGKTYNQIKSDPQLNNIWEAIINWWQTDPNEELDFFGVKTNYPQCEFSEVGFFADPEDENAFYIILDEVLEGFDLLQALTQLRILVHTPTYDDFAGENSFATSVESYVGYGPYKLTSYNSEQGATFERNEYWYGYTLCGNDTYYQATDIVYSVVSEEGLLDEYNSGNSDYYKLTSEDEQLFQSDNLHVESDSRVWFMAFNPDYEDAVYYEKYAKPQTEGNEVDCTVLALPQFRKAIAYVSKSRGNFVVEPELTASIFGSQAVYDRDTGEYYHATEQAVDAQLKAFGLYEEIQELGYTDGYYQTKAQAIADIKTINPDLSKKLFIEAYESMVQNNCISQEALESGKWEVQISVWYSNNSEKSKRTAQLLENQWNEAAKDTPFENKIEVIAVIPLAAVAITSLLKNNSIDGIYGIGYYYDTLNPYDVVQDFVYGDAKYYVNWNTEEEMLDIEIEGYTLRASIYDWACRALLGEQINARIVDKKGELTNKYVMISAGENCKTQVRLTILAKLEEVILSQFALIPISMDCDKAFLSSEKVSYITENKVYGIGLDAIKYITFNYSDQEWENYIASLN